MFNGFGTMITSEEIWNRRGMKRGAHWRNNREFYNWFFYLSNIYLNRFEWQGFPDTVNIRYLEETLYTDAQALAFNDKNIGFLCMACAGEGNMNHYWEFTRYRAIGNCYNEVYEADESVLIRENQLLYPPIFWIELMALKISDAGRTIDTYTKTMKRPWLITCENDDKLTFKTLIDSIDNNEAIIIGNKRLSSMDMKAYSNPSDGKSLEMLWKNKHELMDEVLTFCGINNAETDKKERMIVPEVESNNQMIQASTDLSLDWRKRACEEINKKFGLNITVDLKHDYEAEKEEGENENNNTRQDNKK